MSKVSKRRRTNLTAKQRMNRYIKTVQALDTAFSNALDKKAFEIMTLGFSTSYSKESTGSEDIELNGGK